MEYISHSVPLIIVAGKEYGTGSSRDWAAKGTRLLGVRAVIAESFERIHRSNLIGMGVLPLEFINKENRKKLSISGKEKITILNMNKISPNKLMSCQINDEIKSYSIDLRCRIDTLKELHYYKAGGILQYVLNSIISKNL
jgi:aconitate hydratase